MLGQAERTSNTKAFEQGCLDARAEAQERDEMTQEFKNMSEKSCVETQDDRPSPDGASNNGILVPLKTTLETRARDSFISVYVTSVPVKQASGTLE